MLKENNHRLSFESSDTLKVPVQLLQFVLQNGLIQELRVFLALKKIHNTVYSSKETIYGLQHYLGYKSHKSVTNNLTRLKELGWVDFDRKTNLLFIKGFEALRKKLNLPIRTGVYLYHQELTDKYRFKAFAAGAVVNSLVNSQRRNIRQLELLKGRSKEDGFIIKSGYCKVANAAVASVLQCSLGQAYNLKKLAAKYKYITIKKNFIKTGVHIKDARLFAKGHPELVHLLARKNKELVIKDCDLVMGNMESSRRVKI